MGMMIGRRTFSERLAAFPARLARCLWKAFLQPLLWFAVAATSPVWLPVAALADWVWRCWQESE